MQKIFRQTTAKKKKLLAGIGLLLVVPLITGSIALSTNSLGKKEPAPIAPPQMPKEITTLIETVSKQTMLPSEEMPTVATISDLSKLQDQRFFAKARNGDKVLIYVNAKKAFLYRPTTGQIVQAGGIEIISRDASESARPSLSELNASNSATPMLKIKL